MLGTTPSSSSQCLHLNAESSSPPELGPSSVTSGPYSIKDIRVTSNENSLEMDGRRRDISHWVTPVQSESPFRRAGQVHVPKEFSATLHNFSY
jgi:hypothetical protein